MKKPNNYYDVWCNFDEIDCYGCTCFSNCKKVKKESEERKP